MSKKVKEYIQDDNYRMFVVPVEIFDRHDLSNNEKLAYIALRSFCNAYRAEAWPSYATLGEMMSVTRRTAINVIHGLIKKGLIVKEARFIKCKQEFKHTSNLYKLQSPKQPIQDLFLPQKEQAFSSEMISPLKEDFSAPESHQTDVLVKSFHQGGEMISPDHFNSKDDDEKKDLYTARACDLDLYTNDLDLINKGLDQNDLDLINKGLDQNDLDLINKGWKFMESFKQMSDENGLSKEQFKELALEVISEVGPDEGFKVVYGAMKLTMRLYEKEPVSSLRALFKSNLKKEINRKNTLDRKTKKEKELQERIKKARQAKAAEFTFYNWLEN